MAPVQATLRAASATAALPPSYGSSATNLELQSTDTARPKSVPGTRRTPASEPGCSTVARLHGGVVLLVDPALAGDVGMIEQQLQGAFDIDDRLTRIERRAARAGLFALLGLGIVDGALLEQALAREWPRRSDRGAAPGRSRRRSRGRSALR